MAKLPWTLLVQKFTDRSQFRLRVEILPYDLYNIHKIKQKLEAKMRCLIIQKADTLIIADESKKIAWFIFINRQIPINSDNLSHREKEKTL